MRPLPQSQIGPNFRTYSIKLKESNHRTILNLLLNHAKCNLFGFASLQWYYACASEHKPRITCLHLPSLAAVDVLQQSAIFTCAQKYQNHTSLWSYIPMTELCNWYFDIHNDLISIYHPTPIIFKINMIKEAVNINAILLHVRTWARKEYEIKVSLTFNGIQFYRLTSRVWCLSNAFTFRLFKFPFLFISAT